MRRALLWISLALALVSFTCSARDMRERREFIKENPQPEKCAKGCEVDHKEALMNGGEDKKKNMQWLTKEEHKEKTKKDHDKKRERKGKSR